MLCDVLDADPRCATLVTLSRSNDSFDIADEVSLAAAAGHIANDSFTVDYISYNDNGAIVSYADLIASAVKKHEPDAIGVTEPGERVLRRTFAHWKAKGQIPVENASVTCFSARFQNLSAGPIPAGLCAWSISIEKDACPFNALYWGFPIHNREKLQNNARPSRVY